MSEKLDQKSGYECLHPRLMASTAHRVSLGFKSSQVGDDPDEIIIQTYGWLSLHRRKPPLTSSSLNLQRQYPHPPQEPVLQKPIFLPRSKVKYPFFAPSCAHVLSVYIITFTSLTFKTQFTKIPVVYCMWNQYGKSCRVAIISTPWMLSWVTMYTVPIHHHCRYSPLNHH